MALRAVPEHPKFADFKTILGLPKGAALGWLESVWHFAGRFTPHGDIGKYTDTQIEAWVEWNGEPGALIRALRESGWIDISDQYRLVVHDWHVHADNATKLSVKRSGKSFCIDSESTVSPQGTDSDEKIPTSLGLPVPEPVPVPEPEPEKKQKPSRAKREGEFEIPEWLDHTAFDRFLAMRKKNRKPVTDDALPLLVKKLDALRRVGHDSTAVLDQSTMNGWQGLFEVKRDGKTQSIRTDASLGIHDGPTMSDEDVAKVRARIAEAEKARVKK